jgi:MinD-like ATPase involved in chromosome partitioning or flagellar assembly
MLSALIFGSNPDLIARVHQVCCELEDICVYRSLDRYPQAHEALRLLNSYSPQIVFLEVDDAEAALALEMDIRSFHPSTKVLGVTANPQFGSLFQTGYGSLRVLSLPFTRENLGAAISEALNGGSESTNAPVFAFLPAKAGSGATTLALFSANLVASLAHKKVLLLECDLHAGPVSMLYRLRPAYSIMDVLEDSHRLTHENWHRMVTRAGDIDVLPSLSQQGVRRVSPWSYQRLLSFARSRYDLVICDLPEVVNEATETVVKAAKAVLVVTTPSTPAMHLAARRRHDLEARGVGAAKVKYVVNRKSQPIPPAACFDIQAGQIAAIPVDDNLLDASEFNMRSAQPETVAEVIKIAEFCAGVPLEPPKPPSRSFFASGWFRPASRAPQLYAEHAR